MVSPDFIFGAWAMAAVFLSLPAPAQEKSAMSLDDAFKKMMTYEFDQSREPLTVITDAIRESASNPQQRKGLEMRLAAVLQSDATKEAKTFVCRELSGIGTGDSVPAVASLLDNPDLSHMARYTLERMPDEAAAAALRQALGKVKGKLLVGMINSAGQRKDEKAVSLLGKFLGDADEGVAIAAATALGKIGGADAAKALADARSKGTQAFKETAANSYLLCADAFLAQGKDEQAAAIYKEMYAPSEPKGIRTAALQGLVAAQKEKAVPLVISLLTLDDPQMQAVAARHVREMPGAAVGKAFAEQLPKLSASAQVLVISALAWRGDAGALPAVTEAAKSSDESVRRAALGAMASIGNASSVPLLARVAATSQDAERAAAREALARIRGADVDGAIAAAIDSAQTQVKIELIAALAARRAATAAEALMKAAQDKETAVRVEAFKALTVLADEKALPAMVKLVAGAEDPGVREAAGRALESTALRVADENRRSESILAGLPQAKGEGKIALLRVLGKLGGERALQALRDTLKDPGADVKDAAIRALSDWRDAKVASDLLEIARTAEQMTHRVLALRGYVRVVGLPSDRPAAETLRMYKEAMNAAQRPEDKKTILAGVAQAADLAALQLVEPYLTDEALRDEAAAAAVKIAGAIAGTYRDQARDTMKKVLQAAKNEDIRKQAEEILAQIDKYEDYVTSFEVSGPYTQEGKDCTALFDVAFAPEKGEETKWKVMPTGTAAEAPWLLELDKVIGGDNRVAYLRTNVFSPRQQEVMLEMGSDDGIKVWLNGKVVHANNALRGCVPGQDKVKVTLRRGWNPLLVKVTQGGGQWAAAIRIRGADGGKVEGLKADPRGRM